MILYTVQQECPQVMFIMEGIEMYYKKYYDKLGPLMLIHLVSYHIHIV